MALQVRASFLALLFVVPACGEAEADDAGVDAFTDTSGLTVGSGDAGDTQGEADAGSDSATDTGDGDGDGDAGTATSVGDGDGDSTTGGDGDGDATTATTGGDGDGDGDSTTGGDGDGDSTTAGDDDGDATSGDGDGDGDGDPDCEAPATHITCDALGTNPTADQVVGLNCPGTSVDSTQTTALSITNAAPTALRIATQYGSSGDWAATEGDQLLAITTGNLPAAAGSGVLTVANGTHPGGLFSDGNNANPDNVTTLPAPIRPVNGSGGTPFMGCDFMNDCSDSLQAQWALGESAANDLIHFNFSVDVPPGTLGWNMDFNYMTAEYPVYVNDIYNDIFTVWSTSEAYVGNVCFVGDEPCTVTALATAIEDTAAGGATPGNAKMAGTGMSASEGGATGWYQMSGPTVPGENLTLTFALFDMGDTEWDSVVLLDNWRWNCEGCDPTIPGDCGVTPIPQ